MARTGTSDVYPGKKNGPAGPLAEMPEWRSRSRSDHIAYNRGLEKVAMRGIKWWHWMAMGAGTLAMFVGVVLVIWFGFYRGEVASYGDPLKTYFKPDQGIEGTEIQICFDDIVWKQICPSTLVTHLTPAQGPRLDLQSYSTNPPAVAGRVPPKCRMWKVPMLGENRQPGMAVMSGHLRSECTPLDHWYPIYTQMPSVKFNWLRAR